jgi:hypothetical protein
MFPARIITAGEIIEIPSITADTLDIFVVMSILKTGRVADSMSKLTKLNG